jgi:hypothetical protein
VSVDFEKSIVWIKWVGQVRSSLRLQVLIDTRYVPPSVVGREGNHVAGTRAHIFLVRVMARAIP